ncbi:Hpt domain-containing protein [Clostridium sp. PL3]|uniref:Hpt domain-containing protein n=1 Tax=Clostridium thailandense TaxID=2794346 RepID=A0A949TTZ1_9CLOT|nr:Hpt domain-containing protein [Clostridium thailandense]MBV7273371.1 Hpt domain-containing protein [Clostridium thailandense]
MDTLLDVFFEETKELLEQAEIHLIGLEKLYSAEELNGLFRCIHSIKGSSATLDFREISTLSHKLEDILNYAREGKIELDSEVLACCFAAVDEIVTLFNLRRESYGEEINQTAIQRSQDVLILMDNIGSRINGYTNEKALKLEKEHIYKLEIENNIPKEYSNTYFVRVTLNTSDIMQSVTRFMIINAMSEIGKIMYSNPSLEFMTTSESSKLIDKYECIFNTEVDIEMLYNSIDFVNVKKISVTNITDEYLSKFEMNLSQEEVKSLLEVLSCFLELRTGFTEIRYSYEEKLRIVKLSEKNKKLLEIKNLNVEIQTLIKEIRAFLKLLLSAITIDSKDSLSILEDLYNLHICLTERIYETFKNKLIFKYIKLNSEGVKVERLSELSDKLNRTIFKYVAIDISKVKILETDELKKLIQLHKSFAEEGIKLYIINGGHYRKRLYNIIESIAVIEDIKQYIKELEAVTGNDFILK